MVLFARTNTNPIPIPGGNNYSLKTAPVHSKPVSWNDSHSALFPCVLAWQTTFTMVITLFMHSLHMHITLTQIAIHWLLT